ncbi:MAG: formyl transferase [Geminicoccales bacterium]
MPKKTDGPNSGQIVFLTSGGPIYWIIANALVDEFGPLTIIQESVEPKSVFLKRRVKLLGAIEVAGQIAFGVLARFIYKASKKKRAEIISEAGADTRVPDLCTFIEVPDVNSDECRQVLRSTSPKVVIVVGTRIIKPQTLECIGAPFINYHPGLTPKYRGMNGAYWTLAQGDCDNLAVTVHLVDPGVDTGEIIYQDKVEMPAGHNITTYHDYLATCVRPLVVQAATDALNSDLKPRPSKGVSHQWFHPTLWGYLWTGITRGVW